MSAITTVERTGSGPNFPHSEFPKSLTVPFEIRGGVVDDFVSTSTPITAWLDKAQWPSVAFRGIAQTLPTRSFAEAGMRRSGQLRHLELRVNFFWPRMKMGFVPNAK